MSFLSPTRTTSAFLQLRRVFYRDWSKKNGGDARFMLKIPYQPQIL